MPRGAHAPGTVPSRLFHSRHPGGPARATPASPRPRRHLPSQTGVNECPSQCVNCIIGIAAPMLHFREVQRFRQPWLWAIVAGSLGLAAWQLLRNAAVPHPKTLVFRLALPLLVMVWFAFLALVTEVHDEEVKIQFIGLWFPKHIPIRDI